MISRFVSFSEKCTDTIFIFENTHDGSVGHEVGGWHHLESAGPEPSVDDDGLEGLGLTAFAGEVALATGWVDCRNVV